MRALLLVIPIVAVAVDALEGGDWPQFRGPGSRGAATGADDREGTLPLTCDGDSVAWRKPLPGRGLSSPIVVGGRVVVTANSGARQDRLHVLCLDARSGDQIWERQFWATGMTRCHPKTSMAAPTPVSDGERIVALFASNDVVCLDLDGNLLWLRGLNSDYPQASNSVGMASSPVLAGDTVVVQLENDSDSFAAGLDLGTGVNRWKISRPASVNWSSPVVLAHPVADSGGPATVVLQSTRKVTGHDARTGRELWAWAEPCKGIPSSLAADNLLFVPSDGLTALRPLANGDPEILWRSPRLRTTTASPVLYRGRVYVLTGDILKCAEAGAGGLSWQLRLEGPFSSTPVAAGGHLYLFNEKGLCQVVRVDVEEGGKGEVVSRSDIGETILCTPAIAGGAMFVRSDRSLWRISRR